MATPDRSSSTAPGGLPVEALVRFRAGDSQAFGEVVRMYQPLVAAAVARHFAGAFEREEAAQEIWIHVHRQRETVDLSRTETFSGWLAVLARHRCIDLLRRPIDPSAPSDSESALEWLTQGTVQPATVEDGQLRAALASFVERLKPSWREFFQLHFVEGLDYGEVSARLGIGRLRCKYLRKVLAARARKHAPLVAALGRSRDGGGDAL